MIESTVVDMQPLAVGRAERSLEVLNALADPIRWRVLEQLGSRCRCVCDLQETIDVAPNLLSYHLKVLRDAELVTATRRGRWIDYALAPDARERMLAALPGFPADAATPSGGCATVPVTEQGRRETDAVEERS